MAGHRTVSGGLRKVLQGVLVGAAAALLAVLLWLPGVLDAFEARTWDLRARLFARPGKATSEIATILLDQKSLEWAKDVNGLSWPWPRELYAIIADFCRAGGAKAFIFDVIITEPSSYGVSDDASFAAGMRDNGKVVGAMLLGEQQASSTSWPSEIPAPRIEISGWRDWIEKVRPRNIAFPRAQFPIPEFSRSVQMLGNVHLSPDDFDGVYRREPLFNVFDGRVIPSQALAAWRVGHPQERTIVLRPGTLTLGDMAIPIDSEARAILRFRGPTLTHANYPAASILQAAAQMSEGTEPAVHPSDFKDKYVFFGETASGLFDLRPTPMSGSYPGVEVNATMLDNMLSGDFMRPAPVGATILLLLIMCIGAGLAVSAVSGAGRSALIYVAFIPLAPAFGIAAYALGYWLQVLALELGTVFSLVGASLLNYATEGQQKRYIKGAFKQYLSSEVIEQLIAHPERLKLGGEKRDLTIYFSDLQGFTGLSEGLTPENLTALLNEYLSAMVDIIQEEGGTIDKFEGDAIIAFWNAPLAQPDHAVRGVRAALRCQAKLAEMRPGLRDRVGKSMFMRIGLNSGAAVVGNMGSRTRFNYTMLGDAVNLASRLEGINKQFHTYTMISAAVVEKLAGAFPARELSQVAVVGRKEPVVVYEPMLREEYEARRQALEAFDRGLREYYAGRFPEAEGIFKSIADADPAAASYAQKCRELSLTPPRDDWNGVWVMTEK